MELSRRISLNALRGNQLAPFGFLPLGEEVIAGEADSENPLSAACEG